MAEGGTGAFHLAVKVAAAIDLIAVRGLEVVSVLVLTVLGREASGVIEVLLQPRPNDVLVHEVEQLDQLNAVVRSWCEYYRHTSLQDDLEQISRYTWHRYHGWLRKRHPESRKCQLVQQSSRVVRGRQRWTATLREDSRERFAYQWLPSPRELLRTRYRQKGRDGFAHPYLELPVQRTIPLPRGEKGPPEEIYRVTGRPPDGGRRTAAKDA